MMTNCTGCVYNKGYCSLPRMLDCPVKENNMEKPKNKDFIYKELGKWARENDAKLNGVPVIELFPQLAENEDDMKRNELFDKCLANVDPETRMEVRNNMDYKEKYEKALERAKEDS